MRNDAPALIFCGNDILLKDGNFPAVRDTEHLPFADRGAMGALGPEGAMWGVVSSGAEIPKQFERAQRRKLKRIGGIAAFKLASAAWGLADWHAQAQFCGKCGARMIPAPREDHAMKCPACGHMLFPVICPAVIVAVEKDGKILLAKNRQSPFKNFSVLAGFVEVGESFEDTVRRELMEEVGIEVDGIAYFGSEHWPFPRSLMVGFTARWTRGEAVPDGTELSEAAWFAPDEIPSNVPTTDSIAGRLIEDFKRRFSR